jgi:hypothetical protein
VFKDGKPVQQGGPIALHAKAGETENIMLPITASGDGSEYYLQVAVTIKMIKHWKIIPSLQEMNLN